LKKYSNVRGTSDFDPAASLIFNEVSNAARQIFKIFDYQEIILPHLEEKELFIKGVGEFTDIVERQIFKIEGKDIVLRPEGTAQVIRYFLQNSLYKQSDFHKFFYIGPMFRGERPQKGRLRQFYHLGVEAIGSNSFYLDAEIIILSLRILEAVGIKDKELKINSLGCSEDKQKFARYLQKTLAANEGKLCDVCKKRVDKNPLRVLDCKLTQCRKVIDSLNLTKEALCAGCLAQFKDLLSLLDDLGIKYSYSPYLVRGLDYYTNTVFEISSSKLGSQDAIGAGGRYNNLIKFLGGPDIPATGFALGLERILLVLDKTAQAKGLDVFVAVAGKNLLRDGFKILESLRKQNLACDYDYCDKSLKAQLRIAQKRGARFVVIIGEEEQKKGTVLFKNMEKATQIEVNKEDLIKYTKGEQC
jgi:histidyl-tRNA synthetase